MKPDLHNLQVHSVVSLASVDFFVLKHIQMQIQAAKWYNIVCWKRPALFWNCIDNVLRLQFKCEAVK